MRVPEQVALPPGVPFTLTVDKHDSLWLHTLLDGVPLAIDLGGKDTALAILESKIDECRLVHSPSPEYWLAGDDDAVKFDWE